MKSNNEIETLDRPGDRDDVDVFSAEPTPTDSLDAEDFLIEEELGGHDDLLLDDAELEDEVEFDTQFDETIEDPSEMQLLQDLGIDLDDADPEEVVTPLDFGPVLHDEEALDDEAAA